MDITIQPGKLCGRIAAVPSRSQAHRLMICAALQVLVTFWILYRRSRIPKEEESHG